MSNGLAYWLISDQDDQNMTEKVFWLDDELPTFQVESHGPAERLNRLAFTVGRNPKNLLAHLRRIHFCHRNHLAEPLYAALLDLIIVLQGGGKRLTTRLIRYCRSGLSDERYLALTRSTDAGGNLLASRYSLLTKGMLGNTTLLERIEDVTCEQSQIDYLVLANDHIEYSQLEEAMNILETGLKMAPGRQDLQIALLELYRSMQNRHRFQQQYQELLEAGATLSPEWHALESFFTESTS